MIAKLISFFKGPIGWAVGALIVIFIIAWGYNAIRSDAVLKARLGVNQTEAATDTGADAVNTVAEGNKRDQDINNLTRTNETEIRNADGANDEVKTEVRQAGLEAVCRRAAYYNDPICIGLRNERTNSR